MSSETVKSCGARLRARLRARLCSRLCSRLRPGLRLGLRAAAAATRGGVGSAAMPAGARNAAASSSNSVNSDR